MIIIILIIVMIINISIIIIIIIIIITIISIISISNIIIIIIIISSSSSSSSIIIIIIIISIMLLEEVNMSCWHCCTSSGYAIFISACRGFLTISELSLTLLLFYIYNGIQQFAHVKTKLDLQKVELDNVDHHNSDLNDIKHILQSIVSL